MWKYIFMLLVSLALSSCQQKPEDPQTLYQKYRGSVVLIKNQHYYSLTFDNGLRLYFTLNEKGASPQIYETEQEAIDNASIAFGTGFFIGREGQIATNRHVVNPLVQGQEAARYIARTIAEFKTALNEKIQDKLNEQKKLRNYYEANFLSLDENDVNDLKNAYASLQSQIKEMQEFLGKIDYNPDNTRIQVHVIDIGIAYDDTHVTSLNDFKSCIVIKQSSVEVIDLALIQLKDKRTPEHIKNLIPVKYAVNRKDSVITINDNVYMIGFNEGLQLAITKKGIKSQFTAGTITQEPDEDRMLYSIPTLPGSSGSPIIDQWGNLVAVNFAKISDTQSFSFGIPKKHLEALIGGTSTDDPIAYTTTIPSGSSSSSTAEPASMDSPHDEAYKRTIRSFVAAEDSRNFDQLYSHFSSNNKRFWDIDYPTYDALHQRYQYIWGKVTQSRNIIKEIRKITDRTFDLYTEFEYYEHRRQRTISKSSRVRYHFDNAGKIDEVYGVE